LPAGPGSQRQPFPEEQRVPSRIQFQSSGTPHRLPEQFILALAFVDGKRVDLHDVQNAFRFEPDFGVTSINFNVKDLLTKTVHRRTITLE